MSLLYKARPICCRVSNSGPVIVSTRSFHNSNINNDFISWIRNKTGGLLGKNKPVESDEIPEIKPKLFRDSNELIKQYQKTPSNAEMTQPLSDKIGDATSSAVAEQEEEGGLNSNLATASGEKIDINLVTRIGLKPAPVYSSELLDAARINKWYSTRKITKESELNTILINAYEAVLGEGEGEGEKDYNKLFETTVLKDLNIRFKLFKEISIQTGIPIPDEILTKTSTISHLKNWYVDQRLSYSASRYNENLPNAIHINNKMFKDLGNVYVLPDYPKKAEKLRYNRLLKRATEYENKTASEAIQRAQQEV